MRLPSASYLFTGFVRQTGKARGKNLMRILGPASESSEDVLLSNLRATGNAGRLASPPPRSRLWAGTLLLAAGLAALPS
jgi:hypothetical protein